MATVMSCGTGNWTGPLPGDPDNNSILSAVPAFGGIDVSWSYPTVNPHAVAHVLLYRGISSNYAASVKQATVAGNTFYDKITGTAGTRYYYWIQIVSVNGTVGNVIGPASAIARTRIEDVIADLSGKIEASELGLSLRTSVGKITSNYDELVAKIAAFSGNNAAFMAALAQVQAGLVNALTLISRETTERVNGDSAFASVNEAIAALNRNYVAAILEQSLVRVTAENALALKITNVEVAGKAGTAAAVKTLETSKIGYSALVGTFTPFEGDGVTVVYPALQYPTTTFPEYVSDRTRIIDKLGVDLWNAKKPNKLVWVVGLPLAQAVKSVGISDGDSFMTLEERAVTQKTINGGLHGQYSVKIDANGYIAGFGLSNTTYLAGPSTSNFIINADTFSVAGATLSNGTTPQVSPFMVNTLTGQAMINNAVINGLQANKIDTRGLTIKDAAGTVIFGSGVELAGTYIKDAAVSTLKIGINQVTVPGTGYTSCSVNLPEAGDVYVTANVWMYETSTSDGGAVTSAYSVALYMTESTAGGGYCEQHSAKARHSTTATAYVFSAPAGVSSFYISTNNLVGAYRLEGASIMAVGAMR